MLSLEFRRKEPAVGTNIRLSFFIPQWYPCTNSCAGHTSSSGKPEPQPKWRLESWLCRPARSFLVRVPTLFSWPFPFCFSSIHPPLTPPPPGLCALNKSIIGYSLNVHQFSYLLNFTHALSPWNILLPISTWRLLLYSSWVSSHVYSPVKFSPRLLAITNYSSSTF